MSYGLCYGQTAAVWLGKISPSWGNMQSEMLNTSKLLNDFIK